MQDKLKSIGDEWAVIRISGSLKMLWVGGRCAVVVGGAVERGSKKIYSPISLKIAGMLVMVFLKMLIFSFLKKWGTSQVFRPKTAKK